jgi:hypothetical protein
MMKRNGEKVVSIVENDFTLNIFATKFESQGPIDHLEPQT